MSMMSNSVLCAGFCRLRPSVMFCVRFVRSVLIEWCGLKPRRVAERWMWGVKVVEKNPLKVFFLWVAEEGDRVV